MKLDEFYKPEIEGIAKKLQPIVNKVAERVVPLDEIEASIIHFIGVDVVVGANPSKEASRFARKCEAKFTALDQVISKPGCSFDNLPQELRLDLAPKLKEPQTAPMRVTVHAASRVIKDSKTLS